MTNAALEKLHKAQARTGSLLSVGLEPSLEYLPEGFSKNLEGCEEFLRLLIDATAGQACAYKFNLAFFESHGWEGMELLHAIRERIPDDVLLIADAKRSDIGSTARHYADALYKSLAADACTVNPLMGRDSVEPFLSFEDRLTFFLVLTSNPGAADFLLPDELYIRIARKLVEWSGNRTCGFVVGATWPAQVRQIRDVAPRVPFLVPGIGAQKGDLREALLHGSINRTQPGLIFHVTRSILPSPEDKGDPAEVIREKIKGWNDHVNSCRPQ